MCGSVKPFRALLSPQTQYYQYGMFLYMLTRVCMRDKGLTLPRASHSGEIALAGSRRLRSTLAAAQVLFHTLLLLYRRVPKFSPYGLVCYACAQRPGLPRQSFSHTLWSQYLKITHPPLLSHRYGTYIQGSVYTGGFIKHGAYNEQCVRKQQHLHTA